jgi:hypothetical protein
MYNPLPVQCCPSLISPPVHTLSLSCTSQTPLLPFSIETPNVWRMYFTVGQKKHKCSNVTMETRTSSSLYSRSYLKALLALGTKYLWIYFESLDKFGCNFVWRLCYCRGP